MCCPPPIWIVRYRRAARTNFLMDRRAVELTGGFEFLGPLAQRVLGAGEGLGVASANPFADKPTRR